MVSSRSSDSRASSPGASSRLDGAEAWASYALVLPLVEGRRVLEVGAPDPSSAVRLVEAGARSVVSVQTEAQGGPHSDAVQRVTAPPGRLDFPDDAFDVLLVPDLGPSVAALGADPFLREARRVVAAGGLFVLGYRASGPGLLARLEGRLGSETDAERVTRAIRARFPSAAFYHQTPFVGFTIRPAGSQGLRPNGIDAEASPSSVLVVVGPARLLDRPQLVEVPWTEVERFQEGRRTADASTLKRLADALRDARATLGAQEASLRMLGARLPRLRAAVESHLEPANPPETRLLSPAVVEAAPLPTPEPVEVETLEGRIEPSREVEERLESELRARSEVESQLADERTARREIEATLASEREARAAAEARLKGPAEPSPESSDAATERLTALLDARQSAIRELQQEVARLRGRGTDPRSGVTLEDKVRALEAELAERTLRLDAQAARHAQTTEGLRAQVRNLETALSERERRSEDRDREAEARRTVKLRELELEVAEKTTRLQMLELARGELQDKLRSVGPGPGAADETVAELESDLARLRGELDEARERLSSSESQAAQGRRIRAALEGRVSELERDLEEVKGGTEEEVQRLTQARADLERQGAQSQAEHARDRATLEAALHEAQARERSLEDRRGELEKGLEELRAQLVSSESRPREDPELRARYEDAEGDLRRAREELRAAQDRIGSLEMELARRASVQDAEIQRFAGALHSVEGDRAELVAELEQLRTSFEHGVQERQRADAEIDSLRVQASRAVDEAHRLQLVLDQRTSELGESSARLERTSRALQDREKDVAKLTQAQLALGGERRALELTARHMADELERHRERVAVLREERDTLATASSSLAAERDEAHTHVERLEVDLRSAREHRADASETEWVRWARAWNVERSERSTLERRLDQLELTRAQLEDALGRALGEKAEAEAHSSRFAERDARARQEVSRLRTEVDERDERHRALEALLVDTIDSHGALEDALESSEQRQQGLQYELERSRGRVDDLHQDLEIAEARQVPASRALAAARAQLESLGAAERERDESLASLRALRERLDELESEARMARLECVALRAELEERDHQREIASAALPRVRAREEVERSWEALAMAELRAASAEDRSGMAERERRELEARVEAQRHALARFRQAEDRLRLRDMERHEAIRALEDRLSAGRSLVEKLRQQLDAEEARRQEEEAARDGLQAELDRLRADHREAEAERGSSAQALQTLETELIEAKERDTAWRAQVDELEGLVEDERAQQDQLRAAVEELEGELQRSRDQEQASAREIDALKTHELDLMADLAAQEEAVREARLELLARDDELRLAEVPRPSEGREDLESEVADLHVRLNEAATASEETQRRLEEALREERARALQLSNDLAEARRRAAESRRKATQEAEAAHARGDAAARAQLEGARARIADLEQRFSEVASEVETARAEAADKTGALAATERRVDLERERRGAAESELVEAQQEVSEREKEMTQLKDRIAGVTAERDRFAMGLGSTEAAVKRARDRIDALEAELETARGGREPSAAGHREAELQALRGDLEGLRESYSKLELERDEARLEVREVYARATEAERRAEEGQERIKSVEQELAEARKEMHTVSRRLVETEGGAPASADSEALEQARGHLEQARRELEATRADVDRHREAARSALGAQEKLRAALELSEGRVADLQAELAVSGGRPPSTDGGGGSSDEKKRLERELAAVGSERQRLRRLLQTSEQAQVRMERRVAELEGVIDEAERRRSALERELDDKSERLRRLGGRS
ncbi:MAG: hypothetical protein AAFZ18_00115 [Myxococcota bacterium]